MTDNDTIEIDRELLAEYFHQRYQQAQDFHPADEWAEEHKDGGDGLLFEDEKGAYGYAKGNMIAEGDDLQSWDRWFGIDARGLAEEWAEEHDHDTFEKPPFGEDDSDK